LDGVELIASNEVHPFHLLRYDRAIFSHPAIEKLQLSLKNSASRRDHKADAGEGEKKAQKKAARSPRTRTRKAAEVA
jgi:large subunit ribosomal protein L4